MDEEITLDEWELLEMERIQAFVLNWKAWNKGNPENYPMKMGWGEWDEQLSIYGEA